MSDEIQRSLGRIEGKIDSMLSTQKEHGDRLTDVESFKNKSIGYLMAASAIFAAMMHFIPKAFATIVGGH